jgi:hypothetical protein
MPLLKTPMHFTYLHYLAEKSPTLSKLYFRSALRLCRTFGTSPSILLHPLDFLAADEVPELKTFPGIGTHTSSKLDVLNMLMDELQNSFQLMTIRQFIDQYSQIRKPGFRDVHP